MPEMKSVVEYVELAEASLAASETVSSEAAVHVARAQVYATLALAKATYDRP